jgi:hypothetical protein
LQIFRIGFRTRGHARNKLSTVRGRIGQGLGPGAERCPGRFRLMPTTATLIGYIASGLVLLDWLPPVLSLNLLLLRLNAVRLMRMSKPAPATGHRKRKVS